MSVSLGWDALASLLVSVSKSGRRCALFLETLRSHLPKGLISLYSKVTDSTGPLLPSRVSRNHMVLARHSW
jgi:hypothetical protein